MKLLKLQNITAIMISSVKFKLNLNYEHNMAHVNGKQEYLLYSFIIS